MSISSISIGAGGCCPSPTTTVINPIATVIQNRLFELFQSARKRHPFPIMDSLDCRRLGTGHDRKLEESVPCRFAAG